MPDFRARAMAKQAWLVRRSEPKRGLLLGLIAGGAIGCLGALAVMSVIPNEGPARATTRAATVAANPPTGVQTPSPNTEAAVVKTPSEASAPNSNEVRKVAADRSPAAPAPAAANTTPRPEAARTELSSNAKVPAVTPAEPPATQSLTSGAPVLAQGGTPETKPRVAEKKKKKKQVVKRNRPQPNQFARPDNFFFGGDRMARSF